MNIYTDGACSGKSKNGGWAFCVAGGEYCTTNNRMELTAVIKALEGTVGDVTIHTDSMYVLNGASKFLKNWKRNGWKTTNQTQVKNKDLWKQLDTLIDGRNINWKHVKAHSGHVQNEAADTLAREAIKS